jgi:hypothetical protein
VTVDGGLGVVAPEAKWTTQDGQDDQAWRVGALRKTKGTHCALTIFRSQSGFPFWDIARARRSER